MLHNFENSLPHYIPENQCYSHLRSSHANIIDSKQLRRMNMRHTLYTHTYTHNQEYHKPHCPYEVRKDQIYQYTLRTFRVI
jgi:hypothetical protein